MLRGHEDVVAVVAIMAPPSLTLVRSLAHTARESISDPPAASAQAQDRQALFSLFLSVKLGLKIPSFIQEQVEPSPAKRR